MGSNLVFSDLVEGGALLGQRTWRVFLAATRMLVKPSPEMDIGRIDVEAWAQTEGIVLEQKLIPMPVSVEGILRPYSAMASSKSSRERDIPASRKNY